MKIISVLVVVFFSFAVLAEGPPSADPRLSIGGEARFRYEGRDNSDFENATDDSGSFVGTRIRLNVGFRPLESLEGFIQPQFSNVWGQVGSNISGNGTVTGGAVTSGALLDPTLSLHQGWVHWRVCDDFRIKLGRQELLYGDQLVIGPVGYSNVGRSFDAVKLHFYGTRRWVDMFYAKLAEDDVKNAGLAGEMSLTGLYSSYGEIGPIDTIDGYVLWLLDERAGQPAAFNFATIGMRLSDQWNDIDSRFEGIIQAGKAGSADMFAYMVDIEAGYRLNVRNGLRLALEYNHASGDDPSSGTFTRFHSMFPTAHKWLGYMDFFGRQNIQSGVFHAALKMTPEWTATLDLHSFWRVKDTDLVYSLAAETPLPGQSGSSGSKHVGEELDLVLGYRVNENIALETLGGVFFPGSYLEDAVGGATAWFSYLQATFSL